ncbi:MAG: putative ATPase [Candidatus Midichloriaceae bacterium]|jgi:putative ATPase
MTSLFSASITKPLADTIRPSEFQDVFGQEHLFDNNSPILRALEAECMPNIILWGEAGCGKTTVARILVQKSGCHVESISAVTSSTADIRKIFIDAENRVNAGIKTVVLVDEIHRFNKTLQDIFLPYLENGTITLIGATTENPSFELSNALLSRCKVITLKRLSAEALKKILIRAENIRGEKLNITDLAKESLYEMADGDGRYFLNMCEELFSYKADFQMNETEIASFLQKRMALYDKSKEIHYNLESALHKSLRGSDCQAALYWVCRMLVGGKNPLTTIRRLVRFATEDIGLADPQALNQTLAAKQAYEFLGSPEGELAIAQATIYLANAPKSNAVYLAYNSALQDAKSKGSIPPPKHILNAPTKVMKDLGYSDGYIYDHDAPNQFSGQNYFPEGLEKSVYYNPLEKGFEREMKKRMAYWGNLKIKRNEK